MTLFSIDSPNKSDNVIEVIDKRNFRCHTVTTLQNILKWVQ